MKPPNKDCYETPPWFFRYLTNQFGFIFDLAAEAHNARCHDYFDAEDNALEHTWAAIGNGNDWLFCNPPFSNLKSWVQKAQVECLSGANVVMIAPIKTLCNVYYQAYRAHECRFIVGRIPFEYRGIPQSNNQHNHCVLIWSKGFGLQPGAVHTPVMLSDVKKKFDH